MYKAFLIKYAEIGLKGKNRHVFENRLKDIAVGTVVTPKLLDMQNCRHLFYKFKDNCNLIKKINNNYVRI